MDKHYHITWFDKIEDYHSKGETFTASDEVFALHLFRIKHPNAIFLSCVSAEVLNLKKKSTSIT